MSETVLDDFTSVIASKQHVIFVPSLTFATFPLSDFIYEKMPLFLSKVVSQAPSLTVLS